MYSHIYSIVEDFVKAVEQENLKNSKELVELANSGRFIYAATRQNMNRLMTGEQWEHLRKRNIIESDWGVLKQNPFQNTIRQDPWWGFFVIMFVAFQPTSWNADSNLFLELKLEFRANKKISFFCYY